MPLGISKKRTAIFAAMAATLLPFAALGCGESRGEAVSNDIAVGKELCLLDGVELDYDGMFFDDFTNGVDKDSWYIGKQAWGANGNGGVIPQNVNYTDDGVLVLTGNGEYYTAGDVRGVGTRRDGTLTGAALISKFTTQAGRYEIKMKVLPRLGACNAFWTFAYDNETNANHEIDIELPGGKSTGIITYERLLNTNYHTESFNHSQDTAASDALSDVTSFADGKWHTFGFDWYTLKPGEDENNIGVDTELGKVVYYVDGVVTAVSNVFVPYMQTRLWLGVWFPNNSGFVGDANFETDNMYVDWVRYTPFKDQPFREFVPQLTGDVASDNEYPSAPITISDINKVANGDFEYTRTDKTNSGWEFDKRLISNAERAEIRKRIQAENPESTNNEITELFNAYIKEIRTADTSEYIRAGAGLGNKGSAGLNINKIGLAIQAIDTVYGGDKLDISFFAKGKGKIEVLYMGNGDTAIGSETIDIDSASDFTEIKKLLTAPSGTKRIELEISSAFDRELSVDDVALYIRHSIA